MTLFENFDLGAWLREFEFLGNTPLTWLIFVVLGVLSAALLIIGKKWISGRIERLASITPTIFDDVFVVVLRATWRWFLVVSALWISMRTLSVSRDVLRLVNGGYLILCVVQLARWGQIAINELLENYLKTKESSDGGRTGTIRVIAFLSKVVFYSALVLWGLDNLGVNVTALVAGLGVGGVAVALAVQNILSDLFASFSILLDRPFVAGDFIIVGDHMGTVEHIGIKTTRIRSLSGEQLVCSNTDLLQSRIRNFKRMSERRVVFQFGVVYDTPYTKLCRIAEIVKDIISNLPKVRFERAHLAKFGDSSLDFEVVYWVLDQDYMTYMDLQQAINLECFKRFQDEGISFAFPTRTLYVTNRSIIEGQADQSNEFNSSKREGRERMERAS